MTTTHDEADTERDLRDQLAYIADRIPSVGREVRFRGAQAVLDTYAGTLPATLIPTAAAREANRRRHGVRVIIPGDAEWPTALNDLGNETPICLYVKGDGDLAAMTDLAVAVVGSRAATQEGQVLASETANYLASEGITVVSGCAFGIDAAAHRGALDAHGPTILVSARGLDAAYPAAHSGLFGEVVKRGGLIVSEQPIGYAPYRNRFLARNRIIAALSRATVVVEAGLRSGTLNTAMHAAVIKRPVAAFPGPVSSVQSAGTNRLIATGEAVAVADGPDVLAAFFDGSPTAREDRATVKAFAALPDKAKATLHEALMDAADYRDDVSDCADCTVTEDDEQTRVPCEDHRRDQESADAYYALLALLGA